jgi:hypothetical protein
VDCCVDPGVVVERFLRPRPGGKHRGRAADDGPDAQRCRQSARRTAPDEESAAPYSLGLSAAGSATKDSAPGRMFDAEDADHRAFAGRCETIGIISGSSYSRRTQSSSQI